MAGARSESGTVAGRLDSHGRLAAADPQLLALQREAGSNLGGLLALPGIAEVAGLARKLGVPVSRPAVAARFDHDVELLVSAVPEGEEMALFLGDWTRRPAAPPRLSALIDGDGSVVAPELAEYTVDAELRLERVSPSFARQLGTAAEALAGRSLTRVLRLEEDATGDMPLLAGLAMRQGFSGQRASPRKGGGGQLLLSGTVRIGPDGAFAGFAGQARATSEDRLPAEPAHFAIDSALDEALRSPLDHIIESAESIAERSHGPLRSDYAAYATDISAAARHLLSVIRAMSREPGAVHRPIDLTALAAEATILVEAAAEARGVRIILEADQALPAKGEERAVIQILVNLIGNAIRHSPGGGAVTLRFARLAEIASVTVTDQGPGIDPADQQRIFRRFERADPNAGGTGLGLAISRRLARSMGGDIGLESTPSKGANFSLKLPAA